MGFGIELRNVHKDCRILDGGSFFYGRRLRAIFHYKGNSFISVVMSWMPVIGSRF